MSTVDLHLHTTASDGRLSPSELVHYLAAQKLRFAAITDHDSTEGLPEALKVKEQYPDLTLVPGIELSTEAPGTEVHVLGYFINWQDQEFQSVLTNFRRGRVGRAQGIVERLMGLGLPLEWERVLYFAGDGAVGRPHIALAMVEKGYVSDVRQAFDLYLGRNGPAYVDRQKLTPRDAIEIIRGVGGAAVLAHPSWVDQLDTHLEEMKEAGLAGMEVYYGNYSPNLVSDLKRTADRFDLVPCGGSDYHALGAPDEALPGNVGPPETTVEELHRRSAGAAAPLVAS